MMIEPKPIKLLTEPDRASRNRQISKAIKEMKPFCIYDLVGEVSIRFIPMEIVENPLEHQPERKCFSIKTIDMKVYELYCDSEEIHVSGVPIMYWMKEGTLTYGEVFEINLVQDLS